MSYLLDFNKLEKGDIILCSGKSFGSKIIKLGTLSNFSHVMLYDDLTLIHAIPEGIFSKNPQREIFKKSSHIKILRLKKEIDISIKEKICSYARMQIGSLYGKKEALATILYNNSSEPAKNREQFCSRLVAQSYNSVGINIVKNPDYCSPKDILKSELLESIGGCIKQATQKDIDFAESYDPNLENMMKTYFWLDKVRNLAEEKEFEIQTINDVGSFLIKNNEYDKPVCNFLIESGYLDHYNCDIKINPYRYDQIQFLNQFVNNEVPIKEAILEELKKEPGSIQHFSKNYSTTIINQDNYDLEFFKLHIDLYYNILMLINKRLHVLKEVSIEAQCNEYIIIIDELINNISQLLKLKTHKPISNLTIKANNLPIDSQIILPDITKNKFLLEIINKNRQIINSINSIFEVLEIDLLINPNEITLLDKNNQLPVIIDLLKKDIDVIKHKNIEEGDIVSAIITSQLNEFGQTATWYIVSISKIN